MDAYTIGSIFGLIIPWICLIYVVWYYVTHDNKYMKLFGVLAFLILINVSGCYSVVFAIIRYSITRNKKRIKKDD